MTIDIKGTQLRLNFSFALVLTLMLLFCRRDIVIMCTLASILHECGHIFFMRIFYQKILSIDFGVFGISIERTAADNLSYKKECIIALGGIIINFILAFLCIMYYYLMGSVLPLYFAIINILIALFNCVPIEALDMGRALTCLFMIKLEPMRAQRVLDIISFSFVNILAVLCVVYTAAYNINVSLIAVTVYLYFITLFQKRSYNK